MFKKGNKLGASPTKFTREFLMTELKGMLKEVKRNEDIVFIGELYLEKDYTRDGMNKALDKLKKVSNKTFKKFDRELFVLRKKVRNVLETRFIKKAVTNKYSVPMVKFMLINHYGYTDKSVTDITTKGSKITGVVLLPPKRK